jgi:outer membrane protein OmpU
MGRAIALLLAFLIEALAPAKAAIDPKVVRVELGGYMEQVAGWARNAAGVRVAQRNGASTTSTVLQRPNQFSQQSDAEIWFRGHAKLQDGLVVGFMVQLEANSSAQDQIDESYLFVEGPAGRLVLGSENDVAYLQHVSAPRPASGWSVLETAATQWVVAPRYVSAMTTTAPTTAGDDQKLSYFGSRIAGIQPGASFTPNEREDANELGDMVRERSNLSSLSANGRWSLGGASLALSAGQVHGRGAPRGSFADRRSRLDDRGYGVELTLGEFTLGGGLRRLSNQAGAQDGRARAIGIAWRRDRWSAAAGHLRSRVAGTAANPGRDKADVMVVSGGYELAPGVALVVSGFGARFSNGQSRFGAEDRNRGMGIASGVRLSF